MKEKLKYGIITSVISAVAGTVVGGVLSWGLSNLSTENKIVNEMTDYFSFVDESMNYKQALSAVYDENSTLKEKLGVLEDKNTELENMPSIEFFNPSLLKDGLEISSSVNKGVVQLDGRTYIAVETVDPFMEGTITFDKEKNILAAGKSEGVEVTKEALLDTNILYDGVRYSIIPNDDRESLSVGGQIYRKGVLLDKYYDDSYILLNLKNDYSKLIFEVGRLDGGEKANVELEVYLDGELANTYSLSSDTPIQTLEVPLGYAGNAQIRMMSEHYRAQYCMVNPVLVK